jgi:hypothetical protein
MLFNIRNPIQIRTKCEKLTLCLDHYFMFFLYIRAYLFLLYICQWNRTKAPRRNQQNYHFFLTDASRMGSCCSRSKPEEVAECWFTSIPNQNYDPKATALHLGWEEVHAPDVRVACTFTGEVATGFGKLYIPICLT